MKKRTYKILVGDFETTVFKGQTFTEVWASAIVELYTENVVVLHSLKETLDYLINLKDNITIYYHNLKFDGSFWIDYLLKQENYTQAFDKLSETKYKARQERFMSRNSFKYSISDKGQWYSITIRTKYGKYIEIRDSLKLLPFSVKQIGKAFKTKHQKLDMEYTGIRYAGCTITEEEEKYIKNDVLVVKEALEYMYAEGHNKVTIGSCCLEEYKKNYDKKDWEMFFPDLTKIEIDKNLYGESNADAYIRHSYKGGWCYVKKDRQGIKHKKGKTFDVNSLYPSMMHSDSGNRYPVSTPHFWKGNYIPDEALTHNRYYFVRIKTEFYIKPDKLPFIQIKGNRLYLGTEMLESSEYKDKDGTYSRYYKDIDGIIHTTSVILTLTMTDYQLIKEHYELVNFEILDGCWFYSEIGIFDNYINHYAEIKMKSKGALRTLAKLFLNNLYGKFAMNDDSTFKYAYLKESNTVGFIAVEEHEKKSGYIAIGSAITSYARNFTITAAQKNYNTFCYADTDSIHCLDNGKEIKGITIDPVKFCCWKAESRWDEAIFTRQKTYIEHITHEDEEQITPYYNIKCAGMPQHCKDVLEESFTGVHKEEIELTEEDKDFLKQGKKDLTDFKVGLRLAGKLMPTRIVGGILLIDSYYEMR